MNRPLLDVRDLAVEFPARNGGTVRAVSDLSFSLMRGETLALVGESGCGKSSTARAILQLPPPTRGSVMLDGVDLGSASRPEMRRLRRRMQIVFQDPIASLNPRRRVRDILEAPLIAVGERDRAARRRRVEAMLDAVGLDPAGAMDRRPHEFSGGQCQRISIARALMLEPELLICDEPTSALDVSVQAQIMNLLRDLRERMGLSVLFVSHDLALVRSFADRVLVMYLGRLCEVGPTLDLFDAPLHPYVRALVDAAPAPTPHAPPNPPRLLPGELPSPVTPPPGCALSPRCPSRSPLCSAQRPQESAAGSGRSVACFNAAAHGGTA